MSLYNKRLHLRQILTLHKIAKRKPDRCKIRTYLRLVGKIPGIDISAAHSWLISDHSAVGITAEAWKDIWK